MASPSLREAFLYWLKLGFTSFGGPAGQIALMHQDLVHDKKWISEARFLHALNFCILLPGPEAQQLAIYMGWLLHKTLGGLIAGILFVLPAFLMLCGLAYVYMAHGELSEVQGFFNGVKPAIVALVVFAAYRMGIKTLKNEWYTSVAGLALAAILWLDIPFPVILISAAVLGFIAQTSASKNLISKLWATSNQNAILPDPLIDVSHHSNSVSWKRALSTLTIGIFILSSSFAFLVIAFGQDHLLVTTAWFYTKAAFLTFGGAYAVLPYVFQGAVEHYHWLSAPQMLDALALGESTPGPLIMVITFIGFVTGWTHSMTAHLNPLHTALMVAFVATFFTFLPSFLMIFLGAPLIEKTRQQSSLMAPMSAMTAAVVGMILHLALMLAQHTFWAMDSHQVDWASVSIAIVALIALKKYKVNTLWVILASGLVGIFLNLHLLAS